MDQETKTSGAGNSPEREGNSFLKEAWGFIKVFVITAVIILLFVNIVAHPVTVVGDSMYPNLQDGEYGFTNLIGLRFSAPDRGDVVVVTMEDDVNGDGTPETTHWVKRVIGLPGDTVEARNDVIYINGEPLDESGWLDPAQKQEILDEIQESYGREYGDFTADFGPVTLGEDQYWVMGDNRPHSKDSRDPSVGAVNRNQIYGDGVLILFPFNKIGGH
ncbi:signal peptidase I [Faecalibaculum rodentium]|uniref:Signal peptidase I n=1 Tax=Faecalibaculum rodentium TaxID=1702221 RepID=A0A140DTV4_9FIRM|nr:signal peptidase I [Faecalibaculum rodentium]AMK54081.1 signal peptidase I bacterial type [Faecalibaculum rodentium]